MTDAFAYKRDAKLQARLAAEVDGLARVPTNAICADCSDPKRIRFCSVTLGVFLCNRCYAIHRNVGAHVTRTKCVGLDTWHPDEIAKLRAVGNRRANAEYEAHVGEARKPTAASPDQLEPRVYSKLKLGEYTFTIWLNQLLPCWPLRLHMLVPAASTTLRVPIAAPYMW